MYIHYLQLLLDVSVDTLICFKYKHWFKNIDFAFTGIEYRIVEWHVLKIVLPLLWDLMY